MISKNSRARSLIGGVFAGLIVIWVGVSFYLKMSGLITWAEWGAWFTLGLAALFLLQGIAWLFVPGLRRSFIGMFIPALILAVVGIIPLLGGGWHAWRGWWPFLIVAVGLIIIISTVSGIVSKRRKEKPKT